MVQILLSADPLRIWQIPDDVATIQDALFFSRSGETIILGQGTYYETIYVGGRNIVLTSIDPNDPGIVAATIINSDIDANPETGNGSVIRCVGTEDANSHIRGLTITGGKNENAGGGIDGAGADVSISNCTIVNNSAGNGGGLYKCNGTISGCTITGNSAGNKGGGLCNCSGLIANCVVTGNIAGADGGGLYAAGTLTNCVISDNFAGDSGGAIYNEYGNSIANSTISGNSALLGGGLFYKYALGICNTGASITNSIFANNGNYAIYIGENIIFSEEACEMYPTGLPESMVTYCLFHNNPDGDWYDENTLLLLTGADAINALLNANNNIDNAPLFVDEAESDYHLLPNSPCIDAGDPDYEPEANETDLDGRDRITDGNCNDMDIVDMGAYEFAWIYIGDFAGGCDINFEDFAVLASTWLKEDGQAGYDPNCNISIPADSLIDESDLKIFTSNWLAGVE